MDALVTRKWREYRHATQYAVERSAIACREVTALNEGVANQADEDAMRAFVELVCAINACSWYDDGTGHLTPLPKDGGTP